MSAGKVVKYDPGRGFGFITPEGGGEDLFLHARDLVSDESEVSVGARVEFTVVVGDRGPRAATVRVVAPGAGSGRPVAVDDDGVDVLSRAALAREVTDTLLRLAPSLTGGQIVEIRTHLTEFAARHGWVE